MAASTVSISVVGRTYELSCDEGQENYIRNLAAEVDRRAGDLLRVVGQVGDARLMVMVALSLVDEMGEMSSQFQDQLAAIEAPPVPEPQVIREVEVVKVIDVEADAAMALSLEAMARHIEAIAERLESA